MTSTIYSAMNNAPLLFIDSGIGGLPYLSWIKERMAGESFVYIADSKNFPFGTKSKDELLHIMHETMLNAVVLFNPKAAVIACNTASVISLEFLRKSFDIPFIGVVPAIKPAAFMSENKKIGLMATNRTIEADYTEKLISDFASDCEVFRFAGTEIIYFIENKLYDAETSEIMEILEPAKQFFIANAVDNVVLGCTHFLFLEKELQGSFGGNIRIIDSRAGVGNQIIRILNDHNLLSELKQEKKQNDYFILTGKNDSQNKIDNYHWISEKYGLCAV